jgi:hypothetical protein
LASWGSEPGNDLPENGPEEPTPLFRPHFLLWKDRIDMLAEALDMLKDLEHKTSENRRYL